MEHVTIDIVSDVVCPWCYVGQARLAQAIDNVADDIRVTVNWRPFQLNPDMPPEGADHKTYLAEKFGSREKVEKAHEMLTQLGRDEGIAFDFAAVKISPNTLDAHRLMRWAATESAAVQSKLAALLFRAYFEKGRNVGDHAVLLEVAAEAGLDSNVVSALLSSDADKDTVGEEIEMARGMGVTGVPCFIFDGKYAVMGAQSVDVLTGALRDIAKMKDAAQIN